MFNNKPLLSVITIVYNDVSNIEKTINSVLEQSFKDFEYIVIDGGSKDGTVDVIKKYKAITKWISERDAGISDAFNKGISISQGEWLIFMNSGDQFHDSNVLSDLLPLFKKHFQVDGIYGQVCVVNDNGKEFKIYGREIYSYKKLEISNIIPHQALFLKRNYFEKYGLFDLKYKKVMDYELYLRSKGAIQIVRIERIVAKVLAGGVSQQDFPKLIHEIKQIIKLHTLVSPLYLDVYYLIKIVKFRIRCFIFKLKSSK
jgi:glycosyltransferase involved in cell wall biosynthesis